MNVVILQGRLTEDPIIRDYGTFKTAEFTIAVRRDYKNKTTGEYDTDFIKCKSTRSADYIRQYFHKGEALTVYGKWRIDVYDKDGSRNWYNYCDVSNVAFALTNRPKENQGYNQPVNNQNYSQNNYNQNTVSQNKTEPIFQEPTTNIIPNRMNSASSWQKPIEQKDPFTSTQPAEPQRDIIPQAFDVPMDDEFLPTDGFLF